MKPFVPGDWCWDPYAKQCELCDTVVGRFGVFKDADGTRHITWWPHRAWDGTVGRFRCTAHPAPLPSWMDCLEDLA